jgi:hypothetical protein
MTIEALKIMILRKHRQFIRRPAASNSMKTRQAYKNVFPTRQNDQVVMTMRISSNDVPALKGQYVKVEAS